MTNLSAAAVSSHHYRQIPAAPVCEGIGEDSTPYQRFPEPVFDAQTMEYSVVVKVTIHPFHSSPRNESLSRLPDHGPKTHSTSRAVMTVTASTWHGSPYYSLTFTTRPSRPSLMSNYSARKNSQKSFEADTRAHKSSSTAKQIPPLPCPHCGSTMPPADVSSTKQPTSSSSQLQPLPDIKLSGEQPAMSNEEKLERMKDVMVDKIETPVFAIWRDESVIVGNRSGYELMYDNAGYKVVNAFEFLSRFRVFTPDFETEIDQQDYPLVKLCRSRQPFSKWTVGMLDSKSRHAVFEISGDCVYDEITGEFQAGIIVMTEVTSYTNIIKAQSEQNERQFQLMCETLPQMVCQLFI